METELRLKITWILDEVAGTVSTGDSSQEFRGWLELAAAIRALSRHGY